MRGIAPVLIVIALGIAGMMIAGSGFADVWGTDDSTDVSGINESIDDSASDLKPQNTPIDGPVSSTDSSIVGLISSGLESVTDVAGAVAFLPWTLMDMGFPQWFAAPLGSVAYLLVGISLVEFATNREWT